MLCAVGFQKVALLRAVALAPLALKGTLLITLNYFGQPLPHGAIPLLSSAELKQLDWLRESVRSQLAWLAGLVVRCPPVCIEIVPFKATGVFLCRR